MNKVIGVAMLAAAAICLGWATASVAVNSAKPITGGCPREGIHCLDVYQPVICGNGVVYGNICYAYIDCATDCVDFGDDTF